MHWPENQRLVKNIKIIAKTDSNLAKRHVIITYSHCADLSVFAGSIYYIEALLIASAISQHNLFA